MDFLGDSIHFLQYSIAFWKESSDFQKNSIGFLNAINNFRKDSINFPKDSTDFLKDSTDLLKDTMDFLKMSMDFLEDPIDFLKDSILNCYQLLFALGNPEQICGFHKESLLCIVPEVRYYGNRFPTEIIGFMSCTGAPTGTGAVAVSGARRLLPEGLDQYIISFWATSGGKSKE